MYGVTVYSSVLFEAHLDYGVVASHIFMYRYDVSSLLSFTYAIWSVIHVPYLELYVHKCCVSMQADIVRSRFISRR